MSEDQQTNYLVKEYALTLYLMQERAKGEDSFYYPYISTLPPNYDEFPALQKDEHFDLLEPSMGS